MVRSQSITQALQHGPGSAAGASGPFNSRQLARLDEALTLSSRETGLTFSVYVGELAKPSRAHAEALFERLTDDSVLVAVSPGAAGAAHRHRPPVGRSGCRTGRARSPRWRCARRSQTEISPAAS